MKRVNNSLSSISDKYPTYRDEPLKTSNKWLAGKRIDDNAEGLWRIHDKLYDLSDFVKKHPGGKDWIELTKGVDITEQFETHHITGKAEKLLGKYYVRDAALARNYKITFNHDGFYKTLKRRVADQLSDIDMRPMKISNAISDVSLGLSFSSAILAVKDENVFLSVLSGLFFLWTLVIAHNYFHRKDNWRMYCFNLTLLNHRDWRISHAMSHHLYTNTYYDIEISMFEPWLQWIPREKSLLQKVSSVVLSPIIWILLHYVSAISKIVSYFKKHETFKWDHLIPLILPLTMYFFGKPDMLIVIKYWAIIIGSSGFFFGLVGLNAGHHHPEVAHEGDELKSMDFGIFQLNAVIDRKDLKNNQFLVLTNFGEHTLHHLFPTLDHGVLNQLNEIFLDTCQQFQMELREYQWWPLIAGQFQQLIRSEPKSLKSSKLGKGE